VVGPAAGVKRASAFARTRSQVETWPQLAPSLTCDSMKRSLPPTCGGAARGAHMLTVFYFKVGVQAPTSHQLKKGKKNREHIPPWYYPARTGTLAEPCGRAINPDAIPLV